MESWMELVISLKAITTSTRRSASIPIWLLANNRDTTDSVLWTCVFFFPCVVLPQITLCVGHWLSKNPRAHGWVPSGAQFISGWHISIGNGHHDGEVCWNNLNAGTTYRWQGHYKTTCSVRATALNTVTLTGRHMTMCRWCTDVPQSRQIACRRRPLS